MADLESEASLRIELARDAAGPLVKLSGELDLANVAMARDAVEPLLDERPEHLTFDLSALRFMDSSGIALLVQAAAKAGTVTLAHPSDVVRQVVQATGLAGILHMEP